jgi:hypothetical protein
MKYMAGKALFNSKEKSFSSSLVKKSSITIVFDMLVSHRIVTVPGVMVDVSNTPGGMLLPLGTVITIAVGSWFVILTALSHSR